MTTLVFIWAVSGMASCIFTVVTALAVVCHPDRRRYIYVRRLPNALDEE